MRIAHVGNDGRARRRRSSSAKQGTPQSKYKLSGFHCSVLASTTRIPSELTTAMHMLPIAIYSLSFYYIFRLDTKCLKSQTKIYSFLKIDGKLFEVLMKFFQGLIQNLILH